MPEYATPESAGMDVRAFLNEPIVLKPLERALIPTGLYLQLPAGHECQIRPRSGLALKHGITLVILINLSNEPFTVNDGERICQMVITNYTHVEWEAVERLDETERGDGGFGHTGVN